MIYKVEKDTLVICWADGDRDLPTKFDLAGMRNVMITFSRARRRRNASPEQCTVGHCLPITSSEAMDRRNSGRRLV